MNVKLYATADDAVAQLDSGINGSGLSIPLQAGQGALFPTTNGGTTTSLGTIITLNKTGISAAGGVAVGDFVENITDGSFAYVLAVNTDSLTTSELQGGSNNIWGNGDTYRVNRFIVTIHTKDPDTGAILLSEKCLIDSRATDILTVNSAGRGYDSSTARVWSTGAYVALFVSQENVKEIRKALADIARQIDLRYTKTAVDALLSARNWKQSVRCATTVAGTLASSFENGDTIDGIALATGDRILIKNQAAGAENGIYTVNASGAPTRATDFDSSTEATAAVVPVASGSTLADTLWECTTDNPTIGSTVITFTQLGAAVAAPDLQTFTADGTWTKPSNMTYTYVEMEGAGGGGGGGGGLAAGNTRGGGGAGGGGSFNSKLFRCSELAATVTVVVGVGGAGGAGGSTGNGSNGSAGTVSSFGTFLYAFGGGGGKGSINAGTGTTGGCGGGIGGVGTTATASTAGGLPGSLSSGVGIGGGGAATNAAGTAGNPAENGGASGGDAGADGASSMRGGGAGGGGALLGAGNTVVVAAAAGGKSGSMVAGGGGAAATGTTGVAGTAGTAGDSTHAGYGGGGGGANTSGTGGAGGAGGTAGGGGGGGGPGTTVGGVGGAGGRGEVRVYSW